MLSPTLFALLCQKTQKCIAICTASICRTKSPLAWRCKGNSSSHWDPRGEMCSSRTLYVNEDKGGRHFSHEAATPEMNSHPQVIDLSAEWPVGKGWKFHKTPCLHRRSIIFSWQFVAVAHVVRNIVLEPVPIFSSGKTLNTEKRKKNQNQWITATWIKHRELPVGEGHCS